MSTPTPPPPPAPNGRAARNAFLRGLAFGSIPLLIFWAFGGVAGIVQRTSNPLSYAGAVPLALGVILGLLGLAAVLISTIVCLARRETRPYGYGLLTMLLVSPVLAAIGCQVYLAALNAIPR